MAKREYTNGEITVKWDSDLCTACGLCKTGLPKVFNPDARPWVNMAGATSIEIVDQVKRCPSGALLILSKQREEVPSDKGNQS